MSFLQTAIKLKVEMLKQFNPTVNCLINYFNNIEAQLSNELASILKIVLILSHGQANIEKICGNKTIVKDNMKYSHITEKNHWRHTFKNYIFWSCIDSDIQSS